MLCVVIAAHVVIGRVSVHQLSTCIILFHLIPLGLVRFHGLTSNTQAKSTTMAVSRVTETVQNTVTLKPSTTTKSTSTSTTSTTSESSTVCLVLTHVIPARKSGDVINSFWTETDYKPRPNKTIRPRYPSPLQLRKKRRPRPVRQRNLRLSCKLSLLEVPSGR